MSDVAPSGAELQLERAEIGGGTALACVACKTPIAETYFEANGHVVCQPCRDRLVAHRDAGSPLGRVLGATLAGLVAALVGAGLWYAVRVVTHLEIGLIAIGVGLLVGTAVRRGAAGRGGPIYQGLAVFLTYLAIASSNAPHVVSYVHRQAVGDVEATRRAHPNDAAFGLDGVTNADDPRAADAVGWEIVRALPGRAWLPFVTVVLRSPFSGGVQNAIGWLIVLFALQQAWSLTRAAPFVVGGPFSLRRRDQETDATADRPCPGCGTRVGPSLLACPSCQRLVHADALAKLADEARAAEGAGRSSDALAAWREIRELLPPGAAQRAVVDEKITALAHVVDTGPAAASTTDRRGMWGWALAAVLLLAGKGKALLAGLTKAGTVFSMLAAFGVYWTIWGWRFAAGFVASIFVHEMGHVTELRRFGIRATAPMFIPGVGAVVRFQQDMGAREEARVGLAGPLWGFGAAVFTMAVALATGSQLWAAVAHTGAWINLFNLLPLVPLDGGRGFRPLDRNQRLLAVAVIGAAWWATDDGLLVLLGLAGLYRAFDGKPGAGDVRACLQYGGLVAGLVLIVYGAQGLVPTRP